MAEYPAIDLTYTHGEDTPALLELLSACLDDFEPASIIEHESGDGWRVFFRTAASRDAAVQALHAQHGARLVSLSSTNVEDDGWARRSQAQLTAVRVGRIVIAPPWAREAADLQDRPAEPETSRDMVIVIDPSMGFGTGHHATTRLCLRLLQREQARGRRVIDVGTGSGVLALAAWKLGASRVIAVDCDPDALQNARDNVQRNGAGAAITLVESDLSALELAPADVVLANLTASVLQRYATSLARLTSAGGRLIVSGFAPGERSGVEAALGRVAADIAEEAGWCAAGFTITTPPTRT